MRIRYTATALIEIDDIFAYLDKHNPKVAATFVESVERKLVLLAEFPEVAQTSDEPNVRMTPVGRYPFLIFYTIEGTRS
jgi:plasmid stabilization system protein ParE